MNTSTHNFLAARDALLAQRLDPAAAHRDFRWPVLDEFNWALDYFDVQARGNDAPALHIVGEDGSEVLRSFAQMSQRSDQVANYLRGLGVARGAVVLLMLGAISTYVFTMDLSWRPRRQAALVVLAEPAAR